jgi:hypothetical protein
MPPFYFSFSRFLCSYLYPCVSPLLFSSCAVFLDTAPGLPFCCTFHCVVNLPRSRLSHPINYCSSISRSYLSIPSCPLILSIVVVMHSPRKYAISPSLNLSHSTGSTVFLRMFVCLNETSLARSGRQPKLLLQYLKHVESYTPNSHLYPVFSL